MSSTNKTEIKKTNVPPLVIDKTGISLPVEGDILDGVIQDFQNAFDGKLKFQKDSNNNFLLSTPQGQLVTSIAAIISDRNRLLAYYVNQVDPNYAVGRMQDGIGRIYFIERKRATNTTVVGRCYGAKGTVIPDGTKVKDQQGNVYQSTGQAIIDKTLIENVLDKDGNIVYQDKDGNIVSENTEGGTRKTKTTIYVDVTFECLDKGVITCPKNTLTERYQVIAGWESVNNLSDGTVGIADESQAQFEQRRRQSVAQNSLNSVDSIMAALLTLEEVDDAYVIENYAPTSSYMVEDETIEIPFELKAHSVYVCVSLKNRECEKIVLDENGIADRSNQSCISKQIARTIWSKKTPGCALNGNVPVYVKDNTTDSNGNLLYCPKTAPKYLIKFDFAERINICVKVTLSEPKPVVGDPLTLIRDEIYDSFMGQDGSRKPRIGSQVLASQFYCAVQSLGDWARIVSIKVGFLSDEQDLTTDENGMKKLKPTKDFIQVSINQIPVLSKENIVLNFESNTTGASNG